MEMLHFILLLTFLTICNAATLAPSFLSTACPIKNGKIVFCTTCQFCPVRNFFLVINCCIHLYFIRMAHDVIYRVYQLWPQPWSQLFHIAQPYQSLLAIQQ